MRRVMLLSVCALVLFANPVSASRTVTLTTLNWEPYIGETLKNQGYVAEMVTEAFKRSGMAVEIRYVPWARAVKLAETGAVDGYFPEYFSEELKTKYHVSSALPGGPLGLFKRKGETIPFQKLQDLKTYKIGVVRGYINTAEFDAADYLTKDEATDDLQNFKKLLKGRVDLIVADKYVGLHTLKTQLPDQKDQAEFITPPLETKDLFLCISQKTPDADMLIQAFEQGYQSMIDDGTREKILEKHGFGQ